MIAFFKNIDSIIYNEKYYDIFFENPNENYQRPDFERLTGIFFGFCYMKLLDMALNPTKKQVLEKSKENEDLYKIAVYENGESTGFYNTYDLNLNMILASENGQEALNEYIDSFSDNVKELFEKMNFKKHVEFLVKYDVLDDYLYEVSKYPINKTSITSKDEMAYFLYELIDYMSTDEYYSMGYERILNNDPYSSYYYINESVDKFASLLVKLLLYDTDLKYRRSYKIYDPNSAGAYILHKTKYEILSKNEVSEIKLYGKSQQDESEIIHLAKSIIAKSDSYEIDDATILKLDESIYRYYNYDNFEFIISNYIGCDFNEADDIFKTFAESSLRNVKLVMAIDSVEQILGHLDKIIRNDYLEALISFNSYYIVILNSRKAKSKKGKFLCINQRSHDEIYLGKVYRFSNDMTNLFNRQWKKVNENDLKQMQTILDLYQRFENTDKSILIENDEYDSYKMRRFLNKEYELS